MKIISDFTKDNQSVKPVPGSYEWWYFDGMTAEGYSFVIIFYDGNPFSRRYITALEEKKEPLAEHFPAISISVYKNKLPLFYGFEEVLKKDASYSAVEPAGHVKKNWFSGKRENGVLLYEISLSMNLINGDSIKGKLQFESGAVDYHLPAEQDNSDHIWNLVQPAGKVTGHLQISGRTVTNIEVTGTGYHDHNTGREPMRNHFEEWYWGRVHFADISLIYYLMNENGMWDKKAWLMHKDGRVTSFQGGIQLLEASWSWFGLKSARKIEFTGDSVSGILQLDANLDSGPFYQRFEGRMVLKTEKGIRQARGISEYLVPHRIYDKRFWPLVNMRIKYPGENHWVQKNPVLYRWTW